MLSATLSNYIHLMIKIVVSLFLVRIMFMGMQQEDYGFWALMWSIFGYAVLLEFGLGVTIQKKSAELMEHNRIHQLSKLFSTYLAVYFIIAVMIALSTIVLSFNIESLFVLSDTEKVHEYMLALLVFGLGSAAAFSLGFSAEILVGLHLLKARNLVNTLFVILNAVLLWQCVVWDQPLHIFAAVAVATQFLNNLLFLFVAKHHVRELKFSWKLIDFGDVRRSMQFSLSAYLIMFSNIIIFRTDQIIISAVAGVTFVGLYQIAARVAELFRQFATQFHESLGTKAAMLNARSDKEALSSLLMHSNKIVSAVATALFIPMFLFIEELLMLWLHINDAQTILVARILLVSMYVLVVFRSSMVQVLLMNNKHIELMKIGLLEATVNVILSIILVKQYGMVGAAIGTLLPNVILALFYNIPATLKYSGVNIGEYLRGYLFPFAAVFAGTLYLGYLLKGLIVPDAIIKLGFDAVLVMLVFSLVYGIFTFPKEAELLYKKIRRA